jgi:hypothetical protein
MKTTPIPSREWLLQRFDYTPETGELRWRTRPLSDFPDQHQANATNARFAGKQAGTPGAMGHLHVTVQGTRLLAHRIAWMIAYGEPPASGIDHVDGNPANNALSNLRLADQSKNNHNARKRKSNRLFKGVSRWNNKFRARLTHNGRELHIGAYDTPEEAHAAYCRVAASLRGDFFNPG